MAYNITTHELRYGEFEYYDPESASADEALERVRRGGKLVYLRATTGGIAKLRQARIEDSAGNVWEIYGDGDLVQTTEVGE